MPLDRPGRDPQSRSRLQPSTRSVLTLRSTVPFALLSPQVLISAAEAAEMILRVDDIVKCAPRERNG